MVFEAYEYTPFWFSVRKRCIEKKIARKAMQKYFDMTGKVAADPL